jgi:hypothetical protein
MDVSAAAYVALGATILAAGTMMAGMVWQFFSAFRD